MGVVTLPERFDSRKHLLHVAPRVRLFEASVHSVELPLVGSRADSELQSAIAKQIQKGGFAGNINRMPVGRDDHRCAEADTVGVRRPPGQDLKRIGRNRHLKGMVFRGPDNVEPSGIGHLHHLQGMPLDFGHVGIRSDTLHIDG